MANRFVLNETSYHGKGARCNDASLRDMMHLLRKYDAARCSRNDAMFAQKIISVSDIIHEVNIISDSDIICRRQTPFQK